MKYFQYALIAFILVFMFFLIPREAPERHLHQIVQCQYAQGHQSYSVVFCHSEKAQVSGDIHRYNQSAERFFNGELNQCEPKANL